jgi:hypothetical protein
MQSPSFDPPAPSFLQERRQVSRRSDPRDAYVGPAPVTCTTDPLPKRIARTFSLAPSTGRCK